MLRGWPRGCQGQGWLRIGSLGGALLVEPHLLHAAPTVDRMVRDEVLHVRPRREVVESPDEHRPHGRLFQFPLDLLHQPPGAAFPYHLSSALGVMSGLQASGEVEL